MATIGKADSNKNLAACDRRFQSLVTQLDNRLANLKPLHKLDCQCSDSPAGCFLAPFGTVFFNGLPVITAGLNP